MVNRHRQHVFVLPEDDANRQIANGFLLEPGLQINRIQVLEEAGGWMQVIERFLAVYVTEMNRYPHRYMILLLDYDDHLERLEQVKARIPESLLKRVFILGARKEPEDLKPDLGTFEEIGQGMAKDCREGTTQFWGHPMLRHNEVELGRLRADLCQVLFSKHHASTAEPC